MHNERLDENYREIEYSAEEIKRADTYLRNFEQKESPPQSAKLVKTIPRINADAFIGIGRRIIKSFDPNLNDPYSYMYYKGYRRFTGVWKRWWRFNKIKGQYQKADMSRKFVYFPLHFQPEATTCVCAEKYEKQIFFIDSLAKSLPADTVLYVKEHYDQLGHRDLSFYQEIKKYPNLVLISPFESSRKLIEHAHVVVTLTGTVGYEAMLLRKPVIMVGRIMYDNAPGIVRVDDIYDNYLDIINKWKQPKREDVIKYLCACFRSYSKGNAYAQNYYGLLEENINDLGDSLYEYLLEKKNCLQE